MSIKSRLSNLKNRVIGPRSRQSRPLPGVRQRVAKEFEVMMAELEPSLKPYWGEFSAYPTLLQDGRTREDILQEMAALQAREEAKLKAGMEVAQVDWDGNVAHVDWVALSKSQERLIWKQIITSR